MVEGLQGFTNATKKQQTYNLRLSVCGQLSSQGAMNVQASDLCRPTINMLLELYVTIHHFYRPLVPHLESHLGQAGSLWQRSSDTVHTRGRNSQPSTRYDDNRLRRQKCSDCKSRQPRNAMINALAYTSLLQILKIWRFASSISCQYDFFFEEKKEKQLLG